MGQVKDFHATLRIGGVDYGAWDAADGGDYDSDETKYTPYDGVQRTYLSNPTTSNVTLSRDYRPARDGALLQNHATLQGKAAVAVVLDRDADGNFQQNRPPYSGKVKGITVPKPDSNSSEVAKIVVEISVGVAG